MPVGKDLVERIAFKDTADIEVSEMPDGDERRGVAPCSMLDGQCPNLGLDALEEFVELWCLSSLRGEGEILQVSKPGEDELSSSISRSDIKL